MTSPMDRRAFVTGLGAVLAAPRAVDAQQTKKIPRVGVLANQSPNDSPAPPILTLRQGLRDLGYVEGQDIAIEWRWAHGRLKRLPELAAELVKLEVDIIVAATVPDVQAAQEATSTIPIVMGFASDPVAYGLVASLARPGGNVTGIAEQYADLAPKWLELLGGVVPQVSRVGVLVTAPFWPTEGPYWAALQQAAKTMRVTLHRVEVREPSAFENAFAAMTQEHVQALMVLPHPLVFRHRTRLVTLAAERHLPTIWGPFRECVDAGGLMAYGPSLRDVYRRAAYFVDRILKGTKPGDLPVEQPTKFELVINMKTAKALGLTIPPSLLLRADQVIE